MALRSRSRTATATSGPGRGPQSDGRSRHRRPPGTQGRVRHRHAASADELQRRAEVLFAERAGERRDSGKGPPPGGPGLDDKPAGGDLERLKAAGAVDVTEAGSAADAVGFVERARWEAGAAQEGRPDGGSAEGARRDAGSREGLWRDADTRGESWRDTDSGNGNGYGFGDRNWRERAGSALRERLPVWLQARCGLERRNVVALSVLLVVAAVFAVQHFWTGRTQSVQAPEVVRAAAPFGESGASSAGEGRGAAGPDVSGGVPSTAGPAGAEIVVDVGGKVREPGIQRLPAGSRVADALKAAGGVRPGTNTDALNRARFLVDGEQVIVGGPAAPAPGPGGPAAGGPAAAPVSLNTATVDQLDTLPGVGPVLAQHIVDYRTQHGGFRSVDELREVNGIGDRRFADLRNLVRP
ncbi:helix-hairpin-helix domain-containing protein [Streptomyces canus]|uniref:helix-hairpin-helix domain-containing protein n=1 Tax=Streptomyces canus TaxID=58343 RepID=UPI00225A427C|nr:helix-hairpin-helix domain-containing protein [Streptomyces canus]MCX5259087.1 helix-hairpin-helix domain-containing protein [Streptomyces canus]